jgi:hypothetical protein
MDSDPSIVIGSTELLGGIPLMMKNETSFLSLFAP